MRLFSQLMLAPDVHKQTEREAHKGRVEPQELKLELELEPQVGRGNPCPFLFPLTLLMKVSCRS